MEIQKVRYAELCISTDFIDYIAGAKQGQPGCLEIDALVSSNFTTFAGKNRFLTKKN
jgi:hypothetical protein